GKGCLVRCFRVLRFGPGRTGGRRIGRPTSRLASQDEGAATSSRNIDTACSHNSNKGNNNEMANSPSYSRNKEHSRSSSHHNNRNHKDGHKWRNLAAAGFLPAQLR